MKHVHNRHGFNIVELVVCLAIVSIMSTVIVVGLNGRVKKARITACRADLESVAEAERRVAIDMDYFVRLFVLDDVAGGTTDSDSIESEENNTVFSNPVDGMFIDPNTNDFLSQSEASALYEKLTEDSIEFGWNGPYYHIRRDDELGSVEEFHVAEIPNDPWGNDFLFFTSKGLLEEPEGTFTETVTVSVGGENRNFTANFDRPTILSMGPNRLPGDGEAGADFGTDDDLYVQFGR